MAASLKVIDGDQAKKMNSSEREKALEAALAQIDRAFRSEERRVGKECVP